MRDFVESAKRLYKKGTVTDDKLNQWLAEGRLTPEEVKYIKAA